MVRLAKPAGNKRSRPGVEEQRRSILQAAVNLFGARGITSVSVTAICREARVSRDTFYRCYDDKDQLVDNLYDRAVSANMLTATRTPDADFADPAWLHTTVEGVVDAILAEHRVARFLFMESVDPDSRAKAAIQSAYNEVAATMQRWCRQRYGHAPSRACFTGLLSAAQWLVYEAICSDLKPARVRATKKAIEELFLATFRGLEIR